MGNHTALQAKNRDGDELSVQHTSTDSPILPAANLEQLQRIDPSLVSFVVEQTKVEAEYRRGENKKINVFVFIERTSGVLIGGFIAFVGLMAGFYLILNGHDWAGTVFSGFNLAAIVSVIVTRKGNNNGEVNSQKQKTPVKRSPRR